LKIITSLKILASSALLLCLTTPVHATEDPSRPNVLAIWGDDIGRDPNSTAKCDTRQYQAANAISLNTIAGCLKPKHFLGR